MNSEDETFKILSRCSFREMVRFMKDRRANPMNREEILKENGWTFEEYAKELNKRIRKALDEQNNGS